MDIDRRKHEVVYLWLQSTPGASWRHIVAALREMGDVTTAERIDLKYGRGASGTTIQCNVALAKTTFICNIRGISKQLA